MMLSRSSMMVLCFKVIKILTPLKDKKWKKKVQKNTKFSFCGGRETNCSSKNFLLG